MPEPKTVIRIEPTLPVAREEVVPPGRIQVFQSSVTQPVLDAESEGWSAPAPAPQEREGTCTCAEFFDPYCSIHASPPGDEELIEQLANWHATKRGNLIELHQRAATRLRALVEENMGLYEEIRIDTKDAEIERLKSELYSACWPTF